MSNRLRDLDPDELLKKARAYRLWHANYKKLYRRQRLITAATMFASGLIVVAVTCWLVASVGGNDPKTQSPVYSQETLEQPPCDAGEACQWAPSDVAEARVSDGSFVVDDRMGMSRNNQRSALLWARRHKRDFDKLFFGSPRAMLKPAAVIGFEATSPGTLSGDAVAGGFSCGHDCHVRGPFKRTHQTILRHELAHVLIYRYFGVEERWIHEGTAEWFEDDADYNEKAHDALHDRRGVSVVRLFSGNANDHFAMYVVCASMVDYLVDHAGSEKYGTYLATAGKSGLTPALKTVYGYTPQTLETAWRGRLCRGRR